MSPGEIHGLHARIVADLKRELAEARAEIEQQRTRAEAAEQELREQHAAYIAPMSDKLAAIRAHLAGVDVAELLRKNKSATGGTWTDEKPGRDEDGWLMASIVAATPGRQQIYSDVEGGTYPHADCKLLVALRNAAGALLAAAREALEP